MRRRIFSLLLIFIFIASALFAADKAVVWDTTSKKFKVSDPLPAANGGTGNSNGYALPSGAVFFLITGTCPSGTTDISTTYSNKFIRLNATPASTGGADTHSHTLAETNLPSHTHGIGSLAVGNESSHTHGERDSSAHAIDAITTGSGAQYILNGSSGSAQSTGQRNTDAGSAHTHTLTGSIDSTGSGTAFTGDNVPAYLTLKCCQVN